MDATIKAAIEEITGTADFDWGEARRLAALPSFAVSRELEALRREVENG